MSDTRCLSSAPPNLANLHAPQRAAVEGGGVGRAACPRAGCGAGTGKTRALNTRLAHLVSIPGIAETTAMVLLVEMAELGTLTTKQAASLAGLAPLTRQSGR